MDERRRRRGDSSVRWWHGGTTFLGTTHRAHTGDALSCDHIFATDRSAGGQRSSGCFDAAGRASSPRRVADAAGTRTSSIRTTRRSSRSFRSARRKPRPRTRRRTRPVPAAVAGLYRA